LDDVVVGCPTLYKNVILERKIEKYTGFYIDSGVTRAAFGKEKIQNILSSVAQKPRREFVQVDAAGLPWMNPAQIDNETVVDENPHIIVTGKGKRLVGSLYIGKLGMKLHRESKIVVWMSRLEMPKGFEWRGAERVEFLSIVNRKKLLSTVCQTAIIVNVEFEAHQERTVYGIDVVVPMEEVFPVGEIFAQIPRFRISLIHIDDRSCPVGSDRILYRPLLPVSAVALEIGMSTGNPGFAILVLLKIPDHRGENNLTDD